MITSNAAEACDVVFKALVRYRKFLGSESSASSADSGALAALRVQVDNFEGEHCQYPQHKDDESCEFLFTRVVPTTTARSLDKES